MKKTLLLLLLLLSTSYAKVAIELVDKLDYDNRIFTQGLVYNSGKLYISGGQYNESALYEYNLKDKTLNRVITSPTDEFNEGITIYNDKLYQLTWKKSKGYVYSIKDYSKVDNFSYKGEGWGISNNNDQFVMSDGSHFLNFFSYSRVITSSNLKVEDATQSYDNLNELEWIGDKIYANIWQKDFIVIIDIATGLVIDKIYPKEYIEKSELVGTGVLNGIAYNSNNGLLYITGKNWNYIYVFRIMEE